MNPNAFLKHLLPIFLLVLAMGATPALAVDGFAITVHYEAPQGTLGNIHSGGPEAPAGTHRGKLMRYEIKDDRTVGKKVLYDKTDVGNVRLSPFGDQVAFVRPDGMILVIPSEGGEPKEVGLVVNQPATDKPVDAAIYWPASEGGRWIYYHDNRVSTNSIRRVNLDTKQDEFVVTFNNIGSGDMSPDASPTTGHIVVRTDNYHCRVYSFASGDGDLNRTPDYVPGCGLSYSPDSQLWAANDGTHSKVNLVDSNAQIHTGWRIDQWNGDPTKGITERGKIPLAWQNFRWAANAMNLVSVHQGSLTAGSTHIVTSMDVVVYDWVNQKQFNVTNNPAAHFDRAGGLWEIGGKEAHLGSFQGEAPLTVEIKDSRITGDAAWDFGDGATGKGASAKHAYEQPGKYAMVARRGDMTYTAQVNVLEPKAPSASAFVVNNKCLLLTFDEPVSADKAQLSFASGIKPERFQLNGTGTQMMVYLADALKGSDKLTLKGITDRAQVPNAMSDQPIDVELRPWPANREGLSFVWENASTVNAVFDQKSGTARVCAPIRDRDVAGIGRYGRMYSGLMGLDGSLVTGYYANRQGADIVKAGAFTMECVFEPEMVKHPLRNLENGAQSPYPARIMQAGAWRDESWWYLIGQRDDKLQISIHTSEDVVDENGKSLGQHPLFTIATLTNTRPHHVAVTYTPGKLTAYLDGKQVFETTSVKGELKWGYGELTFGDGHNGGRHGWLGNIENVALYARALDAGEVARNAEYASRIIANRSYPPRVQVEAKVLATTQTPDAQRILPYQEALVVNEYEVLSVLQTDKGWQFDQPIAAGEKIRVAQWGLVPARFNSKKTWVADLKPGDVRTLELEVFEGNIDNLDSVLTSDDLEISPVPLLYHPRE